MFIDGVLLREAYFPKETATASSQRNLSWAHAYFVWAQSFDSYDSRIYGPFQSCNYGSFTRTFWLSLGA